MPKASITQFAIYHSYYKEIFGIMTTSTKIQIVSFLLANIVLIKEQL